MYYLLFYDVVVDYVERRQPFRDEHLGLARQYAERGELLLGGALANPTDGAVLVFKVDSPAAIERFVKNDPYVLNGLVTAWQIRQWTVVVGSAVE